MSAKTRIWVFHMKELIYTAVFVVLGIFFLLLLIFMFSPDQTAQTSEESPSPYTAGIYTTSLMLGGNPVEIAITVDQDYISSIRFRQLSESVAAMYPLMEPALDALSATDLRDAVSGKSFLFRRQPVHFSYAGERHQNSSCQSRKGCPLRQPFSYGVYFSLPMLTRTAPIIIKKSARLNTRSFSRFHGV